MGAHHLTHSVRAAQVIGMLGPLGGRTDGVELNPEKDLVYIHQSAGFITM